MTLKTGTRLGVHEIVAPLGAGGMGDVYKARDTRLDRTVTIKVLSAHLSVDPFVTPLAAGTLTLANPGRYNAS